MKKLRSEKLRADFSFPKKMGAPDPENPLLLGFPVLKGGLRPWSQKGPDHGVGVDPETVIKGRPKLFLVFF